MEIKVGLETVVKEMPETIIKGTDYSYLEPLIPEILKGRLRFPEEIRRMKDENAAEILSETVAKKALDSAGLTTSDIDYIIVTDGHQSLILTTFSFFTSILKDNPSGKEIRGHSN